jgi:fido (protein-threonine AMPylation protein)
MLFEVPDGATPLEEDEKEGLKLSHITTQGELNQWEQQNILEAYRWLDRKKSSDILDEHFVRKLHQQMFGKVWRWAGSFRQSNKNIGEIGHKSLWHYVRCLMMCECGSIKRCMSRMKLGSGFIID